MLQVPYCLVNTLPNPPGAEPFLSVLVFVKPHKCCPAVYFSLENVVFHECDHVQVVYSLSYRGNGPFF
jgi:hypothetical protein